MFPFQYGELVETRHTVGLLSRFIDKERDGSIRMCTDGTRSRMVGQDGNRYRFIPFLQFLEEDTDGSFVQVFDGPDFQIYISFVSGFVAGFDMKINEIVCFQCFEGGMRFSKQISSEFVYKLKTK